MNVANLLAVLVAGCFSLQALSAENAISLAKGQVWFQSDFEAGEPLAGWSGPAVIEPGYASSKAACLSTKPGARGAVTVRSFSVESIRGCTIRGSAMVRAEKVTAKPNPWNGVKFMLVIRGAGGTTYPQAPIETGTFDWRRATFTARIPLDATNVSLVMGLEQVSGKAWFDDIKFVVRKAAVKPNVKPVPGPMFTGHTVPRLRGTMISPNIDAEGLRVLGCDWKANLIRWQLIRFGRTGRRGSTDDYDAWLEGELKKLDSALPHCREDGLMVVVDLHSPPGGKATVSGYIGSDAGLFSDRQAQDKFVEVWRKIARRYKGASNIWGYDLANEPVEDDVEEGCDDWQGLAERTAKAIREIDPERTIIVEPAQWGGPAGLEDLVPLSVSNVVYSVHMYLPHAFTHQGVHEKGPTYNYPGEIQGKLWNKAALERALQPAVDFQRRYNVQIYIGEFSAIRWAPSHSAYRYLADLIDIFEGHGWDWSYHAFREWQGWSVEHGSDPQDAKPAATPTDRQRLLCDWFARNQKP